MEINKHTQNHLREERPRGRHLERKHQIKEATNQDKTVFHGPLEIVEEVDKILSQMEADLPPYIRERIADDLRKLDTPQQPAQGKLATPVGRTKRSVSTTTSSNSNQAKNSEAGKQVFTSQRPTKTSNLG
jgi:hypothetical protein